MDREVKIGKVVVTKSAENLIVSGIGSCLVITLYDPKLKIGALAHAMLPAHHASNPIPNPRSEIRDTKYVDIAIDEMLKRMEAFGTKRGDLEAKLIGGANMFPGFPSDIGKDNVSCAKEKLKKEGIQLIGESLGGCVGRSVEFSVASGIVTVKMKF